MLGINDILNWSLRLGRIAGTEVRISWLMGIWMLFEAINFSRIHRADLIPFAFIIPPLAMFFHALGHALAARMVGGNLDQTVISLINNQDQYRLALRPWSYFLVGISGLVANLLIAAGCYFGTHVTSGLTQEVLGYVCRINLIIGLANLLACQPFDGHRWWRGGLWLFTSMQRAVNAAIILGFISAILLMMFAVWMTDFMLLFIGVASLLATINDRMMVGNGMDPVFGVDSRYIGAAPPSDWTRQRAERQARKAEAEVAAEQEILDRLLAKVSEHGLPALTAGERKQLQKISQRQKQRSDD